MTHINIPEELERFRQRLLDLSNRNQLLNYRQSQRRTLTIIEPPVGQMFDRLVRERCDLRFGAQDLALSKSEASASDLCRAEAKTSASRGRLQTECSENQLKQVTTTMMRAAKAAVEETGVNCLYLALGWLEWAESAAPERKMLAPLMLVPVALDRVFESRRERYEVTVHYTGEEIQANLCLGRRLERDFGIELPSIVDDDEQILTPEQYYRDVQPRIANQQGWRIRPGALLGFFHFTKLFMYLDLDPKNWLDEKSPENNALVRSVIEGADDESLGTDIFAPDYDIDGNEVAERIRLVKDADSSQHSALCDIAAGRSLVIEGPPGTGKSQTITNAIADAMHRGRSVLFVSEKLAALEVVKNNLSAVGLGQFCLELHSDAATPQRLMQDLRERLNFSPHVLAGGAATAREKLTARRERLNGFLKSMQTPLGPQQRPAYEVLWRVSELRSHGLSPLPVSIPLEVDADAFDEACTALHELAAHVTELGEMEKSPWRGLAAERLLPSKVDLVVRWLKSALELSEVLDDGLKKLAGEHGNTVFSWLEHAIDLGVQDALAHWQSVELAPICLWAAELMKPDGVEAIQTLIADVRSARAKMDAAQSIVGANYEVSLEGAKRLQEVRGEFASPRLLDGPVPRASQESPALEARPVPRASQESPALEARPVPRASQESPALEARSIDHVLQMAGCNGNQIASKSSAAWQVSLTALERIQTIAKSLTRLGFGAIDTLEDYEQASAAYLMMFHSFVLDGVPEPVFFSHQTALLVARARLELAQANSACDPVADKVIRQRLPALDVIEELIDVLEAHGESGFAWWNPDYRRARRTMREFTRPEAQKLTHDRQLDMLRSIAAGGWTGFSEEKQLRKTLGPWFRGERTDWDELDQMIRWAGKARQQGLDHAACVSLCEAVDDSPRMTNREMLEPLTQLKRAWLEGSLHEVISRDGLTSRPLTEIAERLQRLSDAAKVVEQVHGNLKDSADSLGELLDSADRLVEAEQAMAGLNARGYQQRFPQLFDGLATNLEHGDQAAQLIDFLKASGLAEDAIARMFQSDGAALKEHFRLIAEVGRSAGQWPAVVKAFDALGSQAESWLPLPGPPADPAHHARLSEAFQCLETLTVWGDYCRAIIRCEQLGLGELVHKLLEDPDDRLRAVDLYDLTLHEQLAEAFLLESGVLHGGSRQALETARREFQQLDQEMIELQPFEIARALCNLQAPSGNSKGRVGELTEMALVRHELNKQDGHVRIRDLMRRAGKAISALKPCIMMSPLSIAQYLEPGAVEFDLVVMDEASQIKPEDAMGALLRAKQVVVVGDPKQLPPTSFFDKLGDESEFELEDATLLAGSESVLEVALKTFPARRRLRWHYRSQHESLIEFSNDRFYDGELVIFPSPIADRTQLGIQWQFVEGGVFTRGFNRPEAATVARAIVQHALEHPDESLGVAAFNAAQAQAIADQLESLVLHDPEARRAVAKLEANPHPLFVKNLESVQGDERDVMLISYTYGPSADTGRVNNRFGPMNGQQGWRRLNVLITRARKRIVVFSSMNPSDIAAGPERSRGVNAMRDYLEYAQLGILPARTVLRTHQVVSPFEAALSRVIQGMGLETVPRVGVAGCFIDVGVLAPGSETEFILGIECDGAAYHQSKSTRDRDRLREQVIRQRGWALHRVWSTDWFLNRESEEKRLQAALEGQLKLRSAA